MKNTNLLLSKNIVNIKFHYTLYVTHLIFRFVDFNLLCSNKILLYFFENTRYILNNVHISI